MGACGGKKQDCAPAKSAAIDELRSQLQQVVKQRQDGRAKDYPGRIDDLHAQLDGDIKIVELGLDCPHLAKASAPDLVPIQSALATLKDRASKVPMPIADAMQPVIAHYEANLGLLSGPSPKIGAWCTTMRTLVTKLEQDTPPLWAHAREATVAEQAATEAKLAPIRERERALRDWFTAVDTGKPVTPSGSDAVSSALAAYQDACHFK